METRREKIPEEKPQLDQVAEIFDELAKEIADNLELARCELSCSEKELQNDL